jgi:hypothetical protein
MAKETNVQAIRLNFGNEWHQDGLFQANKHSWHRLQFLGSMLHLSGLNWIGTWF